MDTEVLLSSHERLPVANLKDIRKRMHDPENKPYSQCID